VFYRPYTPSPPLDRFVDCFWLYGDAPTHRRERILPRGTLELVVNLGDDALLVYDPARPDLCRRFSGALVSGTYAQSFVVDAAQQGSIIGVHFKPGGAFPFLGPPAAELAHQHVDLQALWGPAARELRERLCEARTPGEGFHLLEEALLAHLCRDLDHHGAVWAGLETFAREAGPRRVLDVAASVGLSQRRFIQVFSAEVGLPPKLFSRVLRFQRARLRADVRQAPDWARLALAAGYFDQSHLIRDFLAFSGLSPADYLHQRSSSVKVNHVPVLEGPGQPPT
jgi:AraC-like DNA-binding protein